MCLNTSQGPLFIVPFFWGSNDIKTGEKWLEMVTSLAPVTAHSVTTTTLPAWLDTNSELLPEKMQGTLHTISLGTLTDDVVDVLSSRAPKTAEDPVAMLNIHQMRGTSAGSKSNLVFNARAPHYMFEIASVVDGTGDSDRWARGLHDALANTDLGNILTATYISLTAPEEVDVSKTYGEHLVFLQEMKRERDPDNAFGNALPQF